MIIFSRIAKLCWIEFYEYIYQNSLSNTYLLYVMVI